MASLLIGRTKCPECDEPNAHVKRSEKTLYRHCPSCGSQYMATGPHREALLMAKTRLDKQLGGPTPTGAEKAPETAVAATPAPTPTGSDPTEPPASAPVAPAARRVGLLGLRQR